jgi:hypothetical protein
LKCVGPIQDLILPKPHEGQPVSDLILDRVIRQIEKRAQNQCLEYQHCVQRIGLRAELGIRIRLTPNQFRHVADWKAQHRGPDKNDSTTVIGLLSSRDGYPPRHPTVPLRC